MFFLFLQVLLYLLSKKVFVINVSIPMCFVIAAEQVQVRVDEYKRRNKHITPQ
jgi:hypothetical protein